MPTDYAIVMYRIARQHGVDLLEGLPLALEDLETREFVSVEDYALILERFSDLHPEPDWGFRLGHLFSMANHGPLGFGAMSAPTVRDGLIFLCRYLPARTSYADCRIEYRNQDLHLVFRFDAVALPFIRRHCETFSVIFQSYIESAGAPAAPTIWRFPYPTPENHGHYANWLRGTCFFGATQLRFEVPRAVGILPSAFRNDAGFRSATSQCEAILMEASTDTLVDKVRGILASRIERRAAEIVPVTEIPSADEIADHLQISRRTLIRQLKDAETTFQSLKDALLREHLGSLLADQALSFTQVAERMGYAEAANFTRACKRLFGETPRALRASQMAKCNHLEIASVEPTRDRPGTVDKEETEI